MEIRKIQEIELNILLAFDDVCKHENLTYFLAYGTLLGAVRHKGFIPWDDDVDVCMPREDYQKLMKMENQYNKERYQLVSWENGKSAYPFLKMIDTYTEIHEKYTTKESLSSVWIDIFPLDIMNPSESTLTLDMFRINFYRGLLLLSVSNSDEATSFGMKALKKVLVPICRKINRKKVCATINKIATKYDKNTTGYIGNYVWNEGKKEMMPDSILNLTPMAFENHVFPAPVQYDLYLKRYFGDYMELPPEEQRKPHGFEVTLKENA